MVGNENIIFDMNGQFRKATLKIRERAKDSN